MKVDLGRSKGRIVVEFASIDDLERIVALMRPATPRSPDGLDPVRPPASSAVTTGAAGELEVPMVDMSAWSLCRPDVSAAEESTWHFVRLGPALAWRRSRHDDVMTRWGLPVGPVPELTCEPTVGTPEEEWVSRRLASLTLDNLDDLPRRAGGASSGSWTRWPARRRRRPGTSALEKEAWVSATLLEWGSCGKIVYVDSTPAGYVLYAPPVLRSAQRRLPDLAGLRLTRCC